MVQIKDRSKFSPTEEDVGRATVTQLERTHVYFLDCVFVCVDCFDLKE